MNLLLHPAVGIVLTAVLPWTTVAAQDLVPIQFQVSLVQVTTGSNAFFTLQTITDTFSISWLSPGGSTLGQWIDNHSVLNSVAQYQGRITITATQLKITACQLADAGNYTATVIPSAATGLNPNSLSVSLKVYDAVTQVSVFAPSVAIEGRNASLRCSWATGSSPSVVWSKGGSTLSLDPHVIISGGSLILDPVSRSDAGQYSCTVSNPVSIQTASATLTVYYGPDTPQVTKTSSGCVGGGDATVGQTVQLTCTSVSLPPALLSWQFGSKPLTASQPDGGTLSLQVFFTNQSGQYICTARNSITAGISQQQLAVTVVDTCLSGGAVAGIVIGCFVALVLIIVAIVLILRQRNVDRRLRDAVGVQKTNLNKDPPIPVASPNRQVTSGMPGNGDLSSLRQHRPNGHNISRDHQISTAVWHTGQDNNEMLMQDRLRTLQPNDEPNTGTFLNNGHHNSTVLPHNGHRNSNSFPHNGQHNSGSFPQLGRENPDILIQTGHAEPGTHTVLINLGTLAHGQHRSPAVQPHMVHVNLSTPHPSPGQPNQNAGQLNQQGAMLQQSQPNVQTENTGNAAQSALHGALGNGEQGLGRLVQTDRSYPTNQGLARNITVPAYTQTEPHHRRPNRRRSISPDPMSDSSTHPRQMPWDRLRETPAYPNAQVDESESSGYQSPTSRDRPLRLDPQSTWRSPENGGMQPASQVPGGQLQWREAPYPSQTDLNVQRQGTQPNVNSQAPADLQYPGILADGTQNRNVPQHHTTQTQTAQPTRMIGQTRPDERQAVPNTINIPHPVPLTQSALERHTRQTPNPFTNRIQQTRAALRSAQPIHAQPRPTAQPSHAQPIHAQPSHAQPIHAQPSHAQPIHAQPSHAQPIHAQPSHAQPIHAQPSHAQPSHAQPRPTAQPSHAQPIHAQPIHAQPIHAQPIHGQPSHAQPSHAQPSHAQTRPTVQPNRQGIRPPTPPPVLRPAEFHSLPRKPLEQSPVVQPTRRPDMHRHTRDRHGSPQRHAGNHHRVHAGRHDNGHRHPAHINQQFHRSRPRL